MLSGITDWFQIGGMKVVNDSDITNAIVNCYKNICWNDYNQTITSCKLDISQVGSVFWAYINLFVKEKTQTAKYYYNEPRDKDDNYRKQLITLVAKSSNQDEAFTERVLNYIYSGRQRGIIPSFIHKPREAKKFYDANFFYNNVFKGIFSITDMMQSALTAAAETLTNTVVSVGKGVQELAGAAAFAARNIVWIIGGVAVLGGVIIYKNRDNVKELTMSKIRG